jgi:cyanide hydratase
MPLAPITKYKAAAVQAEPGWFDLEASVQKTIKWIDEAGAAGCKLVVFPETWIPGYPYWMWRYSYDDTLALLKAYKLNSLASDSPEMIRIRSAARRNSIYVVLGYSEIDLATCYLAQIIIAPSGTVLSHRRKIKPTHVERLIFGEGTGDSLDSVVQTDIGRLGCFNCWENLNPLLKAHSAALGEQVHVAAWPLYPPETTRKGLDPYTNVADPQADIITPSYAIETATWVLAPFQIVSDEGAKKNTPEHLWKDGTKAPGCGFSRIIKPDGSRAVADPDTHFEGLLIGEIDLEETILPKSLLDMGGHYTRPDLIRLLVDKRPKSFVVHADREFEAGREQGFASVSTLVRVGLDKPLPDEERVSGKSAKSGEVKENGSAIDGVKA